jgi:hypothetical protein
MHNTSWSPFGWTSERRGGPAVSFNAFPLFLDGGDTDGSANSTRTNGVAFNDWLNKGTLGGTFSNATGTQQPLFASSLLNGRAGATFDGTDDRLVSSLTMASWAFLHNGDGATIYSVVRTSTSAVHTIAATSTGAAASIGVLHRYNTGFAASYAMADGTALRIAINGAAASVNTGLFDIMTSTLASADTPDASVYVQGTSVITGNAAAFTASNPSSTLVVGANPSGGFPLGGDLVLLLADNTSHDAAKRAAVLALIAAKYGVTFPA